MTDPAADFKVNALAVVAKPVLDALAALQANPTTLNLAAQAVALQANLLAAAPALETLGIKDAAAALQAQLEAAIAPSPSPAPAA